MVSDIPGEVKSFLALGSERIHNVGLCVGRMGALHITVVRLQQSAASANKFACVCYRLKSLIVSSEW